MTIFTRAALKSLLGVAALSAGLLAGGALSAARSASADGPRLPSFTPPPTSTVSPLPDLVVGLDAVPGQVPAGQRFSYRFVVRNGLGLVQIPAGAFGLNVDLELPAGVAIDRVDHTPRLRCDKGTSSLRCWTLAEGGRFVGFWDELPVTIFFTAPQQPGTITAQFEVDPGNSVLESNKNNNKKGATTRIIAQPGSVSPEGSAGNTNPNPAPAPVEVVVGVVVLVPDLGVTLRDDVGAQGVSRDGGFQYHAEVQNHGTQRLSHIILSVHFDGAELDAARGDRVVDVFQVGGFQTRVGSDGVYLVEGTLDPGQKANFAIFVHAPEQTGTIRAEATVVALTDGGQFVQETNTANNRVSVTTTVR